MRTNQRKLFALILCIVVLGVFLSGCTVDIVAPLPEPRYGSVNICSDRSGVYGDVFIDGRHWGYLRPNACVFVEHLRIGRYYTVRVDTGWGPGIYHEFYFSSSDQSVTVR